MYEDNVANRIDAALAGYQAVKGTRTTWAGLAKAIGYTPQAPTNWKKGKISHKVLEQIAEYLGADPAWLMYGGPNDDAILSTQGIEKNKLTNPNIDSLNLAPPPNKIKKDRSGGLQPGKRSFGEQTYSSLESDISPSTNEMHMSQKIPEVRLIPVISFVQAGCFKEALMTEHDEYVASYGNLSVFSFGLKIKGDSMRPDFTPGDTIIVDPDVQPTPGDLIIAQNGNHEATFKKYRPRGYKDGKLFFELTPLNSDFPILSSEDQEIRIIGTVVEHFRNLRKDN